MMRKKIVSLCMALVLCLSLLPPSANRISQSPGSPLNWSIIPSMVELSL